MPNVMDVHRFIAEIRKRPALWDLRSDEYKARHSLPNLWKEVSEIAGIDVDQCKRKWKNLRDAYRAEVRRSERRIQRDKLMGAYDLNTNYKSKWVYFESMSFISYSKRRSYDTEHEGDIPNSNSNEKHYNDNETERDNDNDDDFYEINFHSVCDIKLEPNHGVESETHNLNEDDGEETNDMLFEEFQNIATPQAARRLSATLSIGNPLEHEVHLAQEHADAKPSTSSSLNAYNCKCSKRTDEQVHFLEDLGREEQKLIISTKQDITRSNKLDHIGDSDYNFLVSFLPQMKKMNELQNLQFRAKMCEMVLNILGPSMLTQASSIMPGMAVNISTQPSTLHTENTINAATSTSSNNFN